MKAFLRGLAVFGIFLGAAEAGQAQSSYVYTKLDVPGAATTYPTGINASGQIVGSYIDAANVTHGFLLSEGNYFTLDVPGALETQAAGINASGQIVGSYIDATNNGHGFLLSEGNYTTIDVPGAPTSAVGINDSGQIVGFYNDAGGTHGFLLSAGSYTTLDAPGATIETVAYGINTSGQIVGEYVGAGFTRHGFLLSEGNYTTLDAPGSFYGTSATGINDFGQIVGTYVDPRVQHGFLVDGGTYTTLDFPGATGTVPSGINTSSRIVGYYGQHGFVATPVAALAWHGPNPIFTGVTGNPAFLQAIPGTYGSKGNYEVVVPLQSGGIGHFERNNDDPSLPWSGPTVFGTELGAVDAVSLIQSNFSAAGNGPGNLAVLARVGNALVNFYRDDVAFAWHGPEPVCTGVTGVPSFLQARPGVLGSKGDYEMVVPLQSGGIGHFYRNNDDENLAWHGPFPFGTDLGIVDAVSIIQSNFSTAGNGLGNLAVVARVGSQLVYFFRDDAAPFVWHGPEPVFTGASGAPSFIQAIPSTYGTRGDYELVVPLESGGLGHFYRNNDDPLFLWSGPIVFATDQGPVGGVSLIQSNFSSAGSGPGNLAVVSVANNELGYFYRDD